MKQRFSKNVLAGVFGVTLLLTACGSGASHASEAQGGLAPVDPNPITRNSPSLTPVSGDNDNSEIKWKTMESYPFSISFPVVDMTDWNRLTVLKSTGDGFNQHIVNDYFGIIERNEVHRFFFAVLDYNNLSCDAAEQYLYTTADSINGEIQFHSDRSAKKEIKYVLDDRQVGSLFRNNAIKGFVKVRDTERCYAFELGDSNGDIKNFKALDLNEQSKFGAVMRKTIYGVGILK